MKISPISAIGSNKKQSNVSSANRSVNLMSTPNDSFTPSFGVSDEFMKNASKLTVKGLKALASEIREAHPNVKLSDEAGQEIDYLNYLVELATPRIELDTDDIIRMVGGIG